jgi:hypothetical protein
MSSLQEYQSQSEMEMDDEPMIDSNNDSDIEDDLLHLKNFDNEKQLKLLKREIGHIVAHGISPSEGWYDGRFEYINLYSQIDWSGLAKKFHNKDEYLHDNSLYLLRISDELMEERGTKPNFHIPTYYRFIMTVYNIWEYYKQVYAADEEDDIMGLIAGIKSL